MSAVWPLQDAKNKFSEVVDRALQDGPQTVTRRGQPVVVVVSLDTYRRMAGDRPGFKALLRQAPIEGLDLERSKEEDREVVLP